MTDDSMYDPHALVALHLDTFSLPDTASYVGQTLHAHDPIDYVSTILNGYVNSNPAAGAFGATTTAPLPVGITGDALGLLPASWRAHLAIIVAGAVIGIGLILIGAARVVSGAK